jgi:spermidine/putrescine transport system substrate-binding protein
VALFMNFMNRRALLFGLAGAACTSAAPRLNVYNWSDYVAPRTIPDFEREFGVRVRYGTYESNQEMIAKVMSGNSGWDVIFPSADMIQPMRSLGLLQALRHDWLPGFNNLDPAFQHPPWDPSLAFSVPYMHGTTGIVYQNTLVRGPRAWADLWDERLRGKITMLDDPPEVLGACLKKLGYSINSSDPGELRSAQKEAMAQKRLVRAYLNAEVRDQLVAGDVAAAQAWAVTAGQAVAAVPGKLTFVLPAEGFARYADTVAILRESRRSELAHRFISFLLRPEVAAAIVGVIQTATANAAARALLPVELRENPILYPPAEALARGEWFEPVPAAAQRLRDRIWTEIKSA